MDFLEHTPWVPRFIVYHSPWLQDVKPLDLSAFDDKRSSQFISPDVELTVRCSEESDHERLGVRNTEQLPEPAE
jgi:hypothetical protein